MKEKKTVPRYLKSKKTGIVQRTVIIAILMFGSIYIAGCMSSGNTSRQAKIHEMGSQVMPFDLKKTQHIFQMTEYGGIQQVVVRNRKDTEQISLIRQHLKHEATQFKNGNFSDPMSLHGTAMPGVSELSKNASKIKIEYSDVPEGAQITFKTSDIHLITAIHRWFGAQLSDHGSDATYR